MNTLPADPADAAPYGVYCGGGGLPPGVTRPDNGEATMGRGQWHSDPGGRQPTDKRCRQPRRGRF